ncbi:unnamed protein product [Rotaria socialis]|uniref:Large ribosomal subunit protein mL45 n=1 Tax=Rotaria socialis TaxID=392032 RepID=A0A820DDZ2_9BILA|nr:unnamed protein product [Rotaria socialis]CAF4520820.1 unnamed protein product [Rotaria socialis]CAF4582285.1 unnamed protein product [Rotaria socialis]CAF4831485.1 unnamed protein product [Rotaria socialis]
MTMAQVTVRMHSKQTCAIYDRFGRLMFGNETLPKDVLEYVVFERILTNPYSQWRVHSKILPSWLPPLNPHCKTKIVHIDSAQEFFELHLKK